MVEEVAMAALELGVPLEYVELSTRGAGTAPAVAGTCCEGALGWLRRWASLEIECHGAVKAWCQHLGHDYFLEMNAALARWRGSSVQGLAAYLIPESQKAFATSQ